MRRWKFIIGILLVIGTAILIFFLLRSEKALLIQSKGAIARSERDLIGLNYFIMSLIIIPTIIFLFVVVWKYSTKNKTKNYDPDSRHRPIAEVLLWLAPTLIVIVLASITWRETHRLDPYRPIESEHTPLTIQVIALDWKWLFLYPEQGIAALNFVQFPVGAPIRLELSADGSPMNAFWIPQMGGQIYTMTGMRTIYHLIAEERGVWPGRASEINGKGFADMLFTATTCTQDEFAAWVAEVKASPKQLTYETYVELIKPSLKDPVTLYSFVEKDLFMEIMMKYMHPQEDTE